MISVIVCSIDAKRFAEFEKGMGRAMGSAAWELIGIHDARSMAEGYTRGIAQSKGELVVLCHDDIEVLSTDVARRLGEHLSKFDVVGVAGTDFLTYAGWAVAGPPHVLGQVAYPLEDGTIKVDIFGVPRRVVGNIQALDGVFIAARREVFSKVSFDEAFDGFHVYDVDFSYAAYRAGLRLAVVNDVAVLHRSRGQFDATWERYAQQFAIKWAGQLPEPMIRHFQFTLVTVDTRAEALEVMTPTYWDE